MKTLPILLLAALAPVQLIGQDWARASLEKSPRHGEWVKVHRGSRDVECFVVYPEVKGPATAVLVIHEIYGLSDWARSAADQLAAAGYVAIAPDLLSGMGPGGGGFKSFATQDDVTHAVSSLPAEQVSGDLDAVTGYAFGLPATNGKIVVAGFCWGGGKSFAFATHNKAVKAAFVFYGSPPAPEALSGISCPVYGFYAGNDARISLTVPKTTDQMKAAGKTYEPVVYDGAGHGFMRSGQAPDASPANKQARDTAWARWMDLLRGI
jgi:carboxymethylenebutenolidase